MRRRQKMPVLLWRAAGLVLALALALLLPTAPLLAHGGAELTVSPTAIAPGGTIQVKGEGVEAGEEFAVRLDGLKAQVALGAVVVGDDEDFHVDFTVPTDTPPGVYQVTAVSGEGETLTAELTVLSPGEDAPVETPAEPSAEWMQLDRSRSSREWTVIGLGLLLSTGLGLALVWDLAMSNSNAR